MDEIGFALSMPHPSQIVQLTPMMEQYFRMKEKAKEACFGYCAYRTSEVAR
jgi:hypothetical protein